MQFSVDQTASYNDMHWSSTVSHAVLIAEEMFFQLLHYTDINAYYTVYT